MQMTQMTKQLFENFQEFSVMNPSPKLGTNFLGRYVKYKRESIQRGSQGDHNLMKQGLISPPNGPKQSKADRITAKSKKALLDSMHITGADVPNMTQRGDSLPSSRNKVSTLPALVESSENISDSQNPQQWESLKLRQSPLYSGTTSVNQSQTAARIETRVSRIGKDTNYKSNDIP